MANKLDVNVDIETGGNVYALGFNDSPISLDAATETSIQQIVHDYKDDPAHQYAVIQLTNAGSTRYTGTLYQCYGNVDDLTTTSPVYGSKVFVVIDSTSDPNLFNRTTRQVLLIE